MQGGLDLALSQLDDRAREALQRCGYRCRQDFEGVGISDVCDDTGLSEREVAGVLRAIRGATLGTAQPQRGVEAVPKKRGCEEGQDLMDRGAVTFCEAFDNMLGGSGVRRGRLTEIIGDSGSGKTQLAMQLAVDVTIPTSFGGLDGSAVIIDTEGGVTLPRLRDLAEALVHHVAYHAKTTTLTVENVLARVRVVRAFDHHHVCAIANSLQDAMAEDGSCRLIVFDSIAAPFRAWDCGNTDGMVARQRMLAQLGKRLSEASQRYAVAVVVTNQTTHRGGKDADEFIHKAALGNMWSHEVTDSVLLSQDVTGTPTHPVVVRTATMQKSPDLPQASCKFRITPQGFRGA